jgi:predicted ester cyclase
MTREQTEVASPKLGESGMTRDEIVAFFERRQKLYDNLDARGLAADYADDVVVESPSAGLHTGRTAAEQAIRAVFGAFLDMKTRPERLIIDGSRVAEVRVIEGTQIGEFIGMPPTGKPFRLAAVFLYELRDRKIILERRIYDFTGLLLQIGVLKAKPV